MTVATKWEQKHNRRLTAQITVPIEPWVYDKLDELARAEGVTRTEYARAIIMRTVGERAEVAG